MCSVSENAAEWETRSMLYGSSPRGVLFKGLPDSLNEHFHDWHKRIILETIANRENTSVLDVGCGYGRLTLAIKQHYSDIEVVGFDVSANYVRMYEDNTHCRAYLGKLENVSKEIGKYDYIVCVTVLMYIDNSSYSMVIYDLLTHLKHDGKLIVIEPDRSGLPFQTAFGMLTVLNKIRRVKGNSTKGHALKSCQLERAIIEGGGILLDERKMPFTTFNILILYAIAKLLPNKILKCLLSAVTKIDQMLKHTKLPTIHKAYIICKRAE